MRIGVLDIGSNSVQLRVIDTSPGAPPVRVHAVRYPTLFAEAIQADGQITAEGADRMMEAVGDATGLVRSLHVDRLSIFATSAVRDVGNGAEIASRLEQETGVRPCLLTGEEEANLTYSAVRHWYGETGRRLLVLDLGGGSMQIARGRDTAPDFAVSLPLGTGRLASAFLRDDPPSGHQLLALRHHVATTLRGVSERLRWDGVPKRVVASSKTLGQLARLTGAPAERTGPFTRRTLRSSDLTVWIPRLSRLAATESAQRRDSSQSRARQILAGAIVAKSTMTALDIQRLDVWPWAVHESVILHHLETATHHAPLLTAEVP